MCEEGHAGSEYVLTGPQSLTQFEQLAIIGRVTGRPLRIEEISPVPARQELHMPASIIDMLLRAWAAGTGAPARTFSDWVADYASEFSTLLREQ